MSGRDGTACFWILVVSLLAMACTHDRAWIMNKAKSGGVIGYSQSSWSDDGDQVVQDFKKAARKICGTGRWSVVREVIPPPLGAVSAARSAASGDAEGAAKNGGQAYLHDQLFREKRLNKKVKVEYGQPFKSWNEAEIKCE